MSALTREALQEDLRDFATNSLRSELDEVSARVKKDVQQEFKQFLQVFEFWANGPGMNLGGRSAGAGAIMGAGTGLPGAVPQSGTAQSKASPSPFHVQPVSAHPTLRTGSDHRPATVDQVRQAPKAPRARPAPLSMLEDHSLLEESLDFGGRRMRGFGEVEAALAMVSSTPTGKRRPASAQPRHGMTPESPKDAVQLVRTPFADEIGRHPVGTWMAPTTPKARGLRPILDGLEEDALTIYTEASQEVQSPLRRAAASPHQSLYAATEGTDMCHPRFSHRSAEELETALSLQAGAEEYISWLECFLMSTVFNYTIGAFVMLNAFIIGAHTDYVARNIGNSVPIIFRAAEVFFFIVFALEITLRIYVARMEFFTGEGRSWNIFDLIVVALQFVEELLQVFLSSLSSLELNLTHMRVLRFLHVIRIIRTIRVLSLIGELRALATALSHSLECLGWAILLFLLVIYIVAVGLTQIVSEHRRRDPGPYAEDLELYYGSLLSAILSLFQAITGGIDWADAVTPLTREISPLLAVVYSLYVAFGVMAMMNVITGAFLESALRSAKESEDNFMINNVRELFDSTEGGIDGELTWPSFEAQLTNPMMREYFKAIDVDLSEAKHIFRIMDIDDSGSICAREFLHGIFSFRGPAKALDQALLGHEVRKMSRRLKKIVGHFDGHTSVKSHSSWPAPPDHPFDGGFSTPPPRPPNNTSTNSPAQDLDESGSDRHPFDTTLLLQTIG